MSQLSQPVFATLALVAAACSGGVGIDSISPATGSARGGDTVLISGTGFAPDSQVSFGGVDARSVTLLPSGDLQVVTPAAPIAASVAVTVTTGDDDSRRANAFTFTALDLRFVAAAPHYLPDLAGEDISDAIAADLDGDGANDLLIASRSGTSRILPGNGAGTFTDSLVSGATEESAPLLAWRGDTRKLVAADFDNDGDVDVFACMASAIASRLFVNQGGSFTESAATALPMTRSSCIYAAAADLTGDGASDLVVVAIEPGTQERHLEVYINTNSEQVAFIRAAGLATPRDVHGAACGAVSTSAGEIAASFTLTDELAATAFGAGAIHYDFTAVGGHARFALPAPGANLLPEAIDLALHGDGRGVELAVDLEDASGERFTTTIGAVDWSGWKWLRVADPGSWQHSGGNDDGLVDAPIASVGLTISASSGSGDLYVDAVTITDAAGARAVVDDFDRRDHLHSYADQLSSLAAADVDADGDADLFLSSTQAEGNHLRLLVNKAGSGGAEPGSLALLETDQYTLPWLPDPVSLVISFDADHDGDNDAVAIVSGGQDRMLINDGAGYFFDDTTATLPVDRVDGRAATVADMNLDGHPDMVVANHGDSNRLYVSRGDGSFADKTPAMPIDDHASALILGFDADNDGDRDILVVNQSGVALELYVSVPISGARASTHPPNGAGEVIATLPWGGSGHAAGRLDGNESASEGPMSFAVATGGEIYLLDQVNLRVLVLRSDGTVADEVPIPAATFQDLAVWPDGRIVLLDRLAGAELVVIDRKGRVTGQFPLVGDGIPEGGGVTAMFARDDGLWLEFGHTYVVRLLDRDLRACPRTTQPGRIVERGKRSVGAAIDYRGGARLWLGDPATGAMLAETDVAIPDHIARIIWIESDANARIHVLVHVLEFDEKDPKLVLVDKVVGLVYDRDLVPLATYESPHTIVEWEQFREFTVTANGQVLQMAFSPAGVSLLRWR